MSIKTTHLVTREFTLAAIRKKLEEANDSQLENILEEVIHNGFYNFQIVSEEAMEENKSQKYPDAMLTDIHYLPEYNNAG